MGIGLVVGGHSHYGEHVWIMKTWPLLEKKHFLSMLISCIFPKKWPTSTRHKSLNFYHMNEFLHFLETSRCPLQSTLETFFIWRSYLDVMAFDKKPLFVDFENDL